MTLEEQLDKITALDERAMEQTKKRLNAIAKPIGSLGKIEDALILIAGITGDAERKSLERRALLIFAGDHGVVEEGVSQTGSEVTRIVTDNFAGGCSCVNSMAEIAKVDVFPIDIGMKGRKYDTMELTVGRVTDRRISSGTENIACFPAMTEAQCLQAIKVGIDAVRDVKQRGYSVIATGEMGIGNTTPTSALAALWLQQPVEAVTGKGAGLSEEGYARKLQILRQIRQRVHEKHVLKDGSIGAAVAVLADIGGYEIAGMAGAFLGGAIYRIPVMIDGVISAVSALAAVKIAPGVRDFLMCSHVSSEPAGGLLMEALGLEPMLHCGMHLGEGSGAVAMMPLLDMGYQIYRDMGTFEDMNIETYIDHDGKNVQWNG